MLSLVLSMLTANPVDIGSAEFFAILTKTGISRTGTTTISGGDIGVSPAAASYITGFGLTMSASNQHSSASDFDGSAFAADYTSPTPSFMTTAIGDMETAYTDAASRALERDDNLNVKSGLIAGETFSPGVYAFDTDIYLADAAEITFSGDADSIFIIKTTGSLIVGKGANFILNGALAKNIIWQVAGSVSAGTTSHLEGIFLIKTKAVFMTGSSINGRLLAQTAVTLDATAVVAPVVAA